VVLLLPGLSLHLLHLDGVGLPPPHVQLVVTHTQRQDALVDAQPRGVEHKVLHVEERDGSFHVKQLNVRQRVKPATRRTLTGAFLSIGLMTNFLSLKEMFRISLQGKPIFGVNLREDERLAVYTRNLQNTGCYRWLENVLQLSASRWCLAWTDHLTGNHENEYFQFIYEWLV